MTTAIDERRTVTDTDEAADERPTTFEFPGRGEAADGFRRSQAHRWAKMLILLLVLCGLAGAGYALLPEFLDLGGSDPSSGAITQPVSRGRLLVTVTEDGNVESASNIDIKCQLLGGGEIIWIIEDGKYVSKGDKLVEFKRSDIEDQILAQERTVKEAEASKIQAEEDYAAAVIAVEEYDKGTYLQELQTMEAQITIALENLRSSENILEHTERMARKGFVTQLQVEADQFAVKRAQLDLEAAKTAKNVLVNFTRVKTLKTLEAARDAAKAKMESAQAAYNLESTKLKRLKEQLENTVIYAPQDGMAVYANETSRWGRTEAQIEEGATVRERQSVVRLPDLSHMQVKVPIHESKVDQVELGMPARIEIQDKEHRGQVIHIANQPEATSFFQASVKQYATTVSIDGETKGLRPGMTAKVEIRIADKKDALTVPVSAVVELRGNFYLWVQTPQGPEKRPVLLGLSNDKVIEVTDGVKEGELVLLNPRAVVEEARQEDYGEDAAGSFGSESGDAPAGKQPAAGAPGPGRGAGKAAPGGRKESGGRGEGRRRFGDPFEHDKNKDGKLTADELPDQMQRLLEFADADGDGAIDRSELAEMRKKFQSRRGGRGGPGGGADGSGGGGRGGSDGPGSGGPPR